MLDAALRLAREGVAVFPLNEDKSPRVAGGFYAATTKLKQIRAWDWEGALIGHMPDKGVVVIDVDPRNGGDKTLALFPALPRTRTTKTRSGGLHYWLTVDPSLEMRGKLGPGIDVKRHGKGYVAIVPSPGYTYLVTGRMAKAPRWLVEELTIQTGEFKPGEVAAKPRYFEGIQTATPFGEHMLKTRLEELRAAGDGQRHETLVRVAFVLGGVAAGGEIDPDRACQALLDTAVEVGLEEDDAVGVLRRGWFEGVKYPKPATR